MLIYLNSSSALSIPFISAYITHPTPWIWNDKNLGVPEQIQASIDELACWCGFPL
jgi:hypothetical protein